MNGNVVFRKVLYTVSHSLLYSSVMLCNIHISAAGGGVRGASSGINNKSTQRKLFAYINMKPVLKKEISLFNTKFRFL